MQTVQSLHAAFAEALPTIHARRLEALMAALGRSLPNSAWPKQAIKRIDRRKRPGIPSGVTPRG